jgi:hypothetical protein
VASITGVPVTVLVENDKIKMAEINYLCVHKKERETKFAAMLIEEVTRRVNLRDKWQAVIEESFRFIQLEETYRLLLQDPLTIIDLLTQKN